MVAKAFDGMYRVRVVLLTIALTAALTSGGVAQAARGDVVIRDAAVAGDPIIIAKVLDSRLIARGTRSQQFEYQVEILQVLSGRREPWLKSVAHYSSDQLQIRQWNQGWVYLFVFNTPVQAMPVYSEPLSRFGKRKAQVIELIEKGKREVSDTRAVE